ncbi:hypothetical protein Tco_0881283 [Tanacetum coccineum]
MHGYVVSFLMDTAYWSSETWGCSAVVIYRGGGNERWWLRTVVEFMWWDGGRDKCTWCSALGGGVGGFRSAFVGGSTVVEEVLWPPDLGMKYPSLLAIPSPRLYQGIPDKLEWRTSLGVVKPFAKLKNQDRLWSWDVAGSMLSCFSLCETTPDSPKHLFFECPFSSQVWFHLRDLAGLPSTQSSIDLIMDDISPTANRRTSKSVISKLVLAVAYFVWQKRNERLFKGLKRSSAQVIECVVLAVRLKLMSCRFKKSIAGMELMKRWKIPEVLLI